MNKTPWIVVGLSLVASACSTKLAAPPLDLGNKNPVVGWDYSLPFAQYDITIVRTVAACTDQELKLDTSVAATVHYERDPAATYTIDYRSLSAGTKISDLQIEKYPNGMLKKVGASSEDRTGPVIVNSFTTIAKLAQTAAMVAGGGDGSKPTTLCTPEVDGILKRMPTLKAAMEAAKERLESTTNELNAVAAVIAPLKEGSDASTQRLLIQLAKEVVKRQASLKSATVPYSKALGSISDTQKLTWPTNGQDREVSNTLTLKKMNSWLRDADTTPRYQISIAIESTSPLSVVEAAASADTGNANALRYRLPVKGRLVFRDPASQEEEKTILEGAIPQIGRTYLLPFGNGPFQNNVLGASFAEDGTLLTAGYTEKTSIAEAASETAMKVASALPQAVKDVALGGNQFQADQLAAETTVLENRAKLAKARAALLPSPTVESEQQLALLEADTALMDAERAKIAADYALAQARKDPSTAGGGAK